ncbi:HK97-gp10 family putative phage morphogenesis protein [Escherichia albertii]|uniref:HK97-gp10 family putative phage morphogenesis protein n=1 Tax=Escherichia albertii TaxID=208962 RepID=UPI0011EC3C75
MMDFSLDFSGLADIARDLETLSRAENNKVLRDATRAGAEVMRDAVVERAPERTGKLKKNVVVLTQRSKRRGEIISGVHIRGRNLRTGNSDNSMKASDPRNAFYWRFVELGTINMPAHPFIRPAFDTTEELAAQIAIQRMNQAESRITVQIDVWATVPDDADDIREQALDAVRQLAPSVISKTQGYDPDSRLSRATLEFQVIA